MRATSKYDTYFALLVIRMQHMCMYEIRTLHHPIYDVACRDHRSARAAVPKEVDLKARQLD